MKKAIIAIPLLLLPMVMYAQISEQEIKLSGNYEWGEGFAINREEAINNAKRDLIERIIVTVVSEASLNVEEKQDEVTSAFKSNTSTFSRMKIRGLDYKTSQRRDNSWYAVAFVSKNDLNNSIRTESERLLNNLDMALRYESDEQYNQAISTYYELLASTYFIPVPVYTDSAKHGSKTDLKQFVQSKLTSWLNDMDITVSKVRSLTTGNNVELYADLDFKYKNKPVNYLKIALDKPGYAEHEVINGKTSVFIDWTPEELHALQLFKIKPFSPPPLEADLRDFAESITQNKQVLIPINFKDVIELNFNVRVINGKTFIFEPLLKNLTVFDLKWQFEEAGESYDTNPRKLFADFSTKKITLTVNQSEELTISKILHPDGKLTAFEEEKEKQIVQKTNYIEENEKAIIPSSQKKYIDEIIRIKNGQRLVAYLSDLYNKGEILLGKRSDVDNPDLSYVAIINPETLQVYVILNPVENDQRVVFHTEEKIDNKDLTSKYEGLGAIWFQFNE